MDYFFQEQRWTDTFLSLHVKKFKRIILFLLIAFSAAGAKAQSDVTFNNYVRYSQWVIDSRLSDFYGNRKKFGFNTYDSNLNSKNTVSTWYKEDGTNYSIQVDYVAGLVAKATIEAAEYYKNCDWSKPWFKSVEWYGNQCTVPTSPDNLDAINASKMYFGIYNLANSTNGAFKDKAEDGTASDAMAKLGNALTALKYYNNNYAFAANTTLNGKDIAGGWYHKRIYPNQMWLDGQYMGPALLAQLINGYSSYKNNKVSEDDWSLITKQFTIVWDQCWDSENELLYHAFSSEKLDYWTSDAEIWTKAQDVETKWTKMTAPGHSAAFWGRAEGWYFLALVDVLEQMQIAGLTQSTNYTTLKGYLDKLALGIAKRQDATSGCWYQLVGKEGSYKASYYNGNPANEKSNYLESSCTAIFTAAYLKAIRLGLLEKDTYFSIAEKAYKGMVKQFMKQRTDGTVDLLGCCKSAGLGTTGLGDTKFRDGSNAYYLHGHDVAPTSTTSNYYTEGKVLGAFIMAATEYERLYQPSTLLSKDLNSTYTLSSNDSLSVEVLGDGKPKYQWYYVTESTESAIDGATNASYTPTQSGKYYCKITVNPTTAAKTRAASTGPYTITTSTADVTVRGTSTGDTGNAGNAGETVLFYTDFTESEWNEVKTTNNAKSTTAMINGTQVTLKGFANETGFSVSNGTMTFPGNNMSENNYYIAIPVSGVNGSITIEFGGTDGYTYYYDICSSTETPNRTGTNKVSNGIVSVTESYSGTDAIIYIGRRGSSYTTISSIRITTPSSSTPTGYTVTATAANGTVTITDGSGNTIESGSQVNYGTKLVFTATANSGYKFSSWSVTGTQGTADGATYTIASLTEATTVTANFTETSSGGGNNDQPTYVYKVDQAGLTAPDINSSKYITTTSDETGETGEKLVKMTFGGWRWNGGKYIRPETKQEITDSWTASETQAAGVTALDGFNCWFRGTQDAKHEKKDSVSFMYGKNRYGWFVSPTRENGITTVSHPYTLPVRGSFMTFEPTKNGTLTIYILQNGVWNSDTKNNIDIIPGEFRMHAFQITNQRGLVLAEFAPKYSITTNQKVADGYSCTKYLIGDKPATYDKTSKDVSDWEEFWDLSATERKAVHDSWSDPENNGCQKIIKLDNGSFLAIQKAVVKYQFHVTGNETYYFFSNFSKMGFSGATFQPDAAQPTDVTTFSGTNSLSDTKDYTEMTMTPNGTIGDTGLTNYKYTIGGKEVGKVTGVFIPQFKKITLNRTFKKDQWTTLSLPFNLTQTEVEQIFGKGTQIIVFDKAEPTSARIYLTFFYHEIQNVLPGYPYLIRPTLVDAKGNKMVSKSESADNTPTYTITGDGDNITLTEFTVYNKAINPHINQHEFTSGDYTAKCTPSYCTADESYNNIQYSKRYEKGDIFVSEGDGTVYISGGQSYGKGYRSYIEYTGTTPPSAKALSISFSGVEDGDDNGTTTEIRIAELADDVIQTLGIGGVYNLNGQKVADTTRNLPAGIYIVNGRKVVVK